MNNLIQKLDLSDFIASFVDFFARPKEITLQGDEGFHIAALKELETFTLPPLPIIPDLNSQLMLLQKFGILKLDEIVAFSKIIAYFSLIQKASFIPKDGILKAWLEKIIIPPNLIEISKYFDQEGEIKEGQFDELDGLRHALASNKKQISKLFSQLLAQDRLAPYLVDRQIHYLNGNECLLLKAGFNHSIKGLIISRSQTGFFYLCPEGIIKLKEKETQIQDAIQNLIFQICKTISQSFQKHLKFLKFINQSFDTLDHLNARSQFAKSKNLQFLFRSHTQELILHDYAHPALKNPKLLNLSLKQNLLMITGVNAGGKTMLLKSILSCAFLSKYLIPQKINAQKSKIGYFKQIHAIISDPQNSKNDISTFAGRMLEISKILNADSMLLAIDEIELGTDSDEASSLYKSILEHLLQKNNKIIITTHHKRLASLMATHPKVELLAALFDEKNQIPTFGFLQGSIGKSYAFETAMRYNIPPSLIQRAKEHYGDDKEKLNALIEKSTLLELELHQKNQQLTQEIQKTQDRQRQLQDQIQDNKQELLHFKQKLQKTYDEALLALKQEAKSLTKIHQNMNKANQILKTQHTIPTPKITQELQIGQRIKYRNERGVIIGKNTKGFLIECENGMKLKALAHELTPIHHNPPKPQKIKTKITAPKNTVGISLDLHGLRAEEALERADKFLSDCLLAGYDEVLIYHGIGGGVLSKVIKDFLLSHPKVVRFEDAPPQMGGFGAKLIWL
ncbi:endonuclease MutS2 [Helicobacter pametensis]|uniref:endonuclease MutS2 n=1 Tax=Helicobacter pametensis TaxID=95149 RepID=UPI0004884F8B|nr:endonuclease MutS2 [Helicobacter pametensis]